MKAIVVVGIILGIIFYFFFMDPREEDEVSLDREERDSYPRSFQPKITREASPKNEIEEPLEPEENLPASPSPTQAEETVATDEEETFDDEQTSAQEAINNLSDKDLRKVEKSYAKMNQRWGDTVRKLLTEEEYSDYLDMRQEFQMDLANSYRDFHERMEERDQVFNPSDYEEQVGREIRQKHHDHLKEKIGEEKFAQYISEMDKLNEEIKRSNSKNLPFNNIRRAFKIRF